MPVPKFLPRQRLRGVSVLLSAGIPDLEQSNIYQRVPEAALRIEEAVVSVARAVLMDGGTLVLSAHPSISPLVARVAAHYYQPTAAEVDSIERGRRSRDVLWINPSVVMYQSRILEESWIQTSQRLCRHPLVSFQWTDAARGEAVLSTVGPQSQAPRSMAIMRQAMIEDTSPLALIVAGGMEATQAEIELFAEFRPDRPVFAFTTTGGVAVLLSNQRRHANRLRTPDLEAESLVSQFWEKQESSASRGFFAGQEERRYYVPYAFVAQQIVTQIAKGLDGTDPTQND